MVWGAFFSKKNLPKISAWGIFLEKNFLKFLKNFKNFKKNFPRKILEKRYLLQNSSKTHFSRIFFPEKFPKQRFLGDFFFLKKMPPQTIFQENPPPEPSPPDHFSRKILLQTHPLPRPFFQKKISSRPPPPLASPLPPTPPTSLLNLKGVRDSTNKRLRWRAEKEGKQGIQKMERMEGIEGRE